MPADEGVRHVIARAELIKEVGATFRNPWATEDAYVVPAPEDIRLRQNHAKHFDDAVVLYADIDASTSMVDSQGWQFAAECYKNYLRCAAECITGNEGIITAYDGDRVMGVYTGNAKCTNAARTALNINFCVEEIIRPAYAFYGKSFVFNHVVGIDRSELYAIRIGVRGETDITWVGRAANYAAKLCTKGGKSIWISEAVYERLHDQVKFNTETPTGVDMWTPDYWMPMLPSPVYGSNWYRRFP